MRGFFAMVAAGLAGSFLWAGQGAGNQVELKGPHICCSQCVKIAKGLLTKVEGVSDPQASATDKNVTFTAKDEKAAAAGIKALIDGGFFGTATSGGKELKIDVAAAKKGDKADVVTVKDVHVCCGACQKAINNVFKDAKVTYDGKGPQKAVRVEAPGLDQGEVLEALRKAGFNGTLQK